MWWFCVLFVAVSGSPNESQRSGYVSSDASPALTSSGDWPGLTQPNPNDYPISMNGQECSQPGDMFNVVQGNKYYVCACVPNQMGRLVLRCSSCTRCLRLSKSRRIITSVPVLPPPVPVPSPFKPLPSPPVPIPSPFNPVPTPPIPVPSPPVPSPFKPVPSPPVPVPSPFNPVPSPPVPVPSPPIPVPSPPVPSAFKPVPSSPVPVPLRSVPVPSPAGPIPSPPGNQYISGRDGLVIVPASVSTEHCRQRKPFVTFREPNVPCKLFICKVNYNLVYVESFPDPLCSGNNEYIGSRSSDASAEASSNIELWGLGELSEWARSHPSAQVAQIANYGLSGYGELDELDSQSPAQADVYQGLPGLSGYEGFGGFVSRQSLTQTEASANRDLSGYRTLSELGNSQLFTQVDAANTASSEHAVLKGLDYTQTAAHAGGIVNSGVSGYGGLREMGNNQKGQTNSVANVRLSGFQNLGEWSNRQGSTLENAVSNAVFTRYGGVIGLENSDSAGQVDTTANLELSEHRVLLGPFVFGKNGHALKRRSVCLSDKLADNKRLGEDLTNSRQQDAQASVQPAANVFLSRSGGLGLEMGLISARPRNLDSHELNVLGGSVFSSQSGPQAAGIEKGGNFGADLLINDETP